MKTKTNPIVAGYPEGKCPDCAEPIPQDIEEGMECSNCDHVFWKPRIVDDPEVLKLAQEIANRNEASDRAGWMPFCKYGHRDCSMTGHEGDACFDECACELESAYGLELNAITLPEFDEKAVQTILRTMDAD